MSTSDGLSEKEKIGKGYEPRTSGQGQRPNSPKGEKKGKFTIK